MKQEAEPEEGKGEEEENQSKEGVVEEELTTHTPKDFERGSWLDPANQSYGRRKQLHASYAEFATVAHHLIDLDNVQSSP